MARHERSRSKPKAHPEEAPIEYPQHREVCEPERCEKSEIKKKKPRNRSSTLAVSKKVGLDTESGEDSDEKIPISTYSINDIIEGSGHGTADDSAMQGSGAEAMDSGPCPRTPGAFAVPGIGSDVEVREGPGSEILFAPLPAHTVGERGSQIGANDGPVPELARCHRLGTLNVPLVIARVLPGTSGYSAEDTESHWYFWKRCSRRFWGALAVCLVIFTTTATLIAVLIPQTSSLPDDLTLDDLEDIPENMSTSPPTPAQTYSLSPSLSPTVDPELMRIQSITSLLTPISGEDALSNFSSPQYQALQWVSLKDPLQLPYGDDANETRLIQRYILATLYFATGGEYWHLAYHFLEGIHECHWWNIAKENIYGFTEEGVFCSKGLEVGEVDHIHMIANNVTGTLPNEVQYLSTLKVLYIYETNIEAIPTFLGSIPSLEAIYFYRNTLVGGIPESLGKLTLLERLLLEVNYLTGSIPSSLGNLTSLEQLRISRNFLNGAIPSTLRHLSSLEVLDLQFNALTGTISESLGNLTSLEELWLNANFLNGTIPSTLGRLTSLKRLDFHWNDFIGSIPKEICVLTEENLARLSADCDPMNEDKISCNCCTNCY